jgi:hypothetical protein
LIESIKSDYQVTRTFFKEAIHSKNYRLNQQNDRKESVEGKKYTRLIEEERQNKGKQERSL